MLKKYGKIIVSIVVVVGLIGFIGYALTRPEQAPQAETEAGPVGTTGSSNVFGKADSPVQLTEYVDFQCEACYAYFPIVKEVKEKYKDKVKFQIKNFPISNAHANSLQAAQAAQAAAKQGKFFEMHNLLFEKQKEWEEQTNFRPTLDKYAKQIGLNMGQFDKDFGSDETKGIINFDLKEVTEIGGKGTPTFVLNGKLVENPGPSVDALSKLLDAELAKAGIQ